MDTNNVVQLQDKIDGHNIYPKTLASLVQTSDGSNIEEGKANKSEVYTKNQIDILLEDKQNTLINGETIKTINSESILGNGNIVLAGLDEATKQFVIYKALKQGQEQMVVLKSMGDLDALPLDSSLSKYDFNEDGTINYAEISILYSIMLGVKYDGFYYKVVTQTLEDSTSTVLLQKSEDNVNWTTIEGKRPDISEDGSITTQDVTRFFEMIYTIAEQQGIAYDRNEFTGGTTVFSAYDSKEKKIIIGHNFEGYIDPSNNKNAFILLKLDPSPNVIYCNSFNNKLYRWNANSKKMVELILSSSSVLSGMNDLLHRVEQVEKQIEKYEGTVDNDEPTTPVDPSRN